MRSFIIRFLRVGLQAAHPCKTLFILLGLVFPALCGLKTTSRLAVFHRCCIRNFSLLAAGLALCSGLGALSANAYALMGGAVQNGGMAPGNVSGASGVTVSTLAGSTIKRSDT